LPHSSAELPRSGPSVRSNCSGGVGDLECPPAASRAGIR
jgi:hypothetical protein